RGPLFYYRVGTITVKNGCVELIGVMQMENRGLKEGLIRAIFRPAIVPFIHVGVMEFVAMGVELGPLHASMEDIQDVVKDFVERQFRLWPFLGLFQMGVNVSYMFPQSPTSFRNLLINK